MTGDNQDLILNDYHPSEETVRRWAYDENLYFIEQDEDGALHDAKYIPLMVELASADDCPKAEYIANILDDCARIAALYETKESLEAFRGPVLAASHSSQSRVRAWASIMERRFAYRHGMGEVDAEQADFMAKDLLCGISRCGAVERTQRALPDHWEYKYFTSSYAEFLYINKRSGNYLARQYCALTPDELAHV